MRQRPMQVLYQSPNALRACSMDAEKKMRVKISRPKRPIKNVLASVRQVIKVQHVADQDSIWIWGKPHKKHLPLHVKFVIWNLWKGSGGAKFRQEFKALVEASDLALTQEALLTHEMIACSAVTGYQVVHGATYRRVDGCRDGVMTLCSAELAKAPERVISGTAEPFLKTTKASLLTYYRYGNAERETLAVANLHSTLMRRPRTAGLEIRRVIERLEEHDGPVIFAGDFNTFSKAYLREIIKALKILDIEHVDILLDPRTRTGKLDQVFVRGIKINKILVDVSFKQSDHFPILCDGHIIV